MAITIDFDGANSWILLSGVGDLTGTVPQIYSSWKQWVQSGENSKYLSAMRSVGGDPISDTQNLGATYFLTNDWRIRTKEEDHNLVIQGNIYTDPFGFQVVLNTTGNYNVQVKYEVSNLVDALVENIESLDYNGTVVVSAINGEVGTTYPVGTAATPALTMESADEIADRYSIRSYHIEGPYTGSRWVYNGYDFFGDGPMPYSSLTATGNHFHAVRFDRLVLLGRGHMGGTANDARNCILQDFSGWNGTLDSCSIQGTIHVDGSIAGRDLIFLDHPYSTISYIGRTGYFNGNIKAGNVMFRDIISGAHLHITASNSNLIIIDSTVADGVMIHINGSYELQNNSNNMVLERNDNDVVISQIKKALSALY